MTKRTAKRGKSTVADPTLQSTSNQPSEKASESREATPIPDERRSLTLGEYAYQVITEQVERITKREDKVLADHDPEHLHQMRVGTRRLRTALQVFDCAVELPKAARYRRVGELAKVLGKLRDLDVQIAALETDYFPHIQSSEQGVIQSFIESLKKQRRKAFSEVKSTLHHTRYSNLKAAYKKWDDHPQFKPLARLNLLSLLPDLLNPLVSELFLHSGWLVNPNSLSESDSLLLHDLRKACKHARYQAEFFSDFYGDDFKQWLQEIKEIQAQLGTVQDGQILVSLLADYTDNQTGLENVTAMINQRQQEALSGWEAIAPKYISPDFRHHLHQVILSGSVG